MCCLIWMNPKQLHLVAGEDNEPKNTALALKNRKWCGAAAGTAVAGRGDEENKDERKREGSKKKKKKNDRDKPCKDGPFTVKRCLWRKITINLVKSWSENTPALPDCWADSITFLLIFFSLSLSLSESTALSKSPPDFQLLSLVVVPDKQNLLDQADFTAAPAHMAASVAHSLSWGGYSPTPLHTLFLCLKFTFLQIPTQFSPTIIHQVLLGLFSRSFALWREPHEGAGMQFQTCTFWGGGREEFIPICGTWSCHS